MCIPTNIWLVCCMTYWSMVVTFPSLSFVNVSVLTTDGLSRSSLDLVFCAKVFISMKSCCIKYHIQQIYTPISALKQCRLKSIQQWYVVQLIPRIAIFLTLAKLAQPEHEDYDSSGYDTSTASLTSSIHTYLFENGRRYHSYYGTDKYLLPTDETEQDRYGDKESGTSLRLDQFTET